MDKDALRSVFSHVSRNGWSLRSDVQLQEWLEDFAERLKGRTKEVAAEVLRLGTETGNVELLLQNNFNSLRALSATQFIENRVDEVDEVFVKNSEQPIRQSRVESYDSQIIPRYKEAVLTAWDAFEEFNTRKTSLQSSDVRTLQTKPVVKLPHIIGTEEFSRDPHCGLADFNFVEVNNARAPSSEPVESGSDTDRDEARMAAEMVGERTWLEGEWFASESETSGHQGGVLEPAVSAALDFKAMLEAALRGPSFSYDGRVISNLENAHVQHSFAENASTSFAHDTDSNTSRTRSSPKESKLDGDLSTKNGHTPVEHSVQYQNQELISEALEEPTKTELLQPPIHMPPASNRIDHARVAGSIGPPSPWTSTPPFTPNLPDGSADDPEPSLGISLRSGSPPKGVPSIVNIRNNTTGTSLSLNLRTEESKLQQPALEYRPSATPDDPPMPTLPDGLFQGLQAAMQARQLRSQRNEVPQEGKERPDMSIASVSAEKPFTASRSPPVKLNLKESKSKSKSKVETASRFQKGVSASKTTSSPISFQGGLFDDDDLDEMSDFLSKEGTVTPEFGIKQIGDNQGPSLTGPLTAGSSSMVRKGLFDDFGDFSIGSASESEVGGASSSGLEQRTNAATTSQQSVLSLPDRKDASKSRVLKKSLFGDSDGEDNDLFGD